MAHAPFSGDFESLARQYWNTWNELLGRGGTSDAWSLMGGLPPGLGRMDPGSFDWYGRMQRLAADFSGGGNPGDVARAWRDLLGGQGADPFAGMLRSMHGGLAGGEWIEQMRPMLDMLLRPLRQQGADWLQRPTFGPAREHQERLQALALAWQEWEQRNEAFNALLVQAGQGAFERFEHLLQEHDAPGKRLESARALFDLWIDAAEQAWAEIALSAEYRHAYAEMTNALMRLRLGLQREVEQFGTMLGLPGRSEVDALHRKVADLERSLHAARRGAAAQRPAPAARKPAAAEASPPVAAAAPDVVAVGSKAAPRRKRARAPVRKSSAAARRPAKRAAESKPASKKSARKPAPASRPRPPRPAAARAVATTATVRATQAAKAKAEAAVPAKKGVAGKSAKQVPQSAAARAAAGKAGKARPASRAIAKTATARRKPAAASTPASVQASGKSVAAASRRVPDKPAPGRAAASPATRARAKHAGDSARKPSRPTAAASPATPGTAKVVSMKDWVSRNLAATPPEGAAAAGRKSGGKRGGRGR